MSQPILIPIAEVVARRLCDVHFKSEWQEVMHPLLGQDVYMSGVPGAAIRFACPPEVTGILLLRHGWSGAAKITVGDDEQVVPLHAEAEERFVVPLKKRKKGGNFELSVSVESVESAKPGHSQVWILGLQFAEVPKQTSKSVVVSSSCRLITGDWGRFLVLNTDTVLPAGILAEGAWAPKDIEIFRQHVGPGSVVLDVGANLGHHSVVFSKLVGSSGLVLSIEAQRVMHHILCANLAINSCDNVRPFHMAASDREGTLNLYPISYTENSNFGALGIDRKSAECGGGAGEEVRAIPLDNVVEEALGSRKVDFAKLDVQSHELFVFLGMMRTLRRCRPKIFFEVAPYWNKRAGYDYRELYRILATFGYKFQHFYELPLGDDGIPNVDHSIDIEWDVLAVAED